MKISKAVIPCGGMGTRFLPITKSVPKEILPVTDTPVLAYIINEAIDSGITDILIVLGNGKEAIKSYFSPNAALEDALMRANKPELVELVKSTYSRANIVFAYQDKPLGSGDAVLRAEKFVGKEPFALAWGDDLIHSSDAVMGQLISCYNRVGTTVLGVQEILTDDIVKYGVANTGSKHSDRCYKCMGIVEKPPLANLPSRLAALGRYIITPNVFDIIRTTPAGKGGELQFTDTLNEMCASSGVHVYDFVGRRYDMGDKFGSIQAVIEYGLRSPEYGQNLKKYLQELAKKI